ncbi:MAG: outer membrane beta-barrel protein, partial [Hydrogenothermaceae bacterium]
SKEINSNLKLAVNLDYQWLDKTVKTTGHDDKGYGLAIYIIPQFDKLSTPIRLEYVNDGSKRKESGIYNSVSKAYTLTITPTYKPTKNSYIRAEVSCINSDNYVKI